MRLEELIGKKVVRIKALSYYDCSFMEEPVLVVKDHNGKIKYKYISGVSKIIFQERTFDFKQVNFDENWVEYTGCISEDAKNEIKMVAARNANRNYLIGHFDVGVSSLSLGHEQLPLIYPPMLTPMLTPQLTRGTDLTPCLLDLNLELFKYKRSLQPLKGKNLDNNKKISNFHPFKRTSYSLDKLYSELINMANIKKHVIPQKNI